MEERLDIFSLKGILLRHHLVDDALDGLKNLGRAHSVRSNIARLARDLLLDTGDANLEELIEVRAHDSEKLDPFEQRLGWVLRLFKDSAIKLKPAQLAIDEILRGGKVGAAGLPRPRFGRSPRARAAPR